MNTLREQAAQAHYAGYHFGQDITVEDAGDWTVGPGPDQLSRAVWVSLNHGPGMRSPALRISFCVQFGPGSDRVIEAFASDPFGAALGYEASAVAPLDGEPGFEPTEAAALRPDSASSSRGYQPTVPAQLA